MEPPMQIETFFPYQLAITAEAFSRQLVAVYGHAFGLTREEWRVLFVINGAGEITSLDLARRSSLDKVQISRAAQRLEEKGLILRSVAGEDRRLRRYAMTPAGTATFVPALDEVRRRAEQVLAEMTEADRTGLDRGLKALREACAKVDAKRQAPTPS
jgi:DNA-binding MarR family transcriptional regulator